MSSKSSDAKQFARFLRVIADRLENEPDFLYKILPTKVQDLPIVSDFDLLSAVHDNGIETVRQRLATMDLDELKAMVFKYGLDTAGKVRKWKQKERIIDFLIESISRRVDFGTSVFPISSEQKKTEK